VREAVLVHLLDEVAEHLLGDVEVGDDAVLERADRGDRAGRAPEHALGLDPDRVDVTGALVDRDDRGFGEDDAAPAHVDERVGGAEVDGHVPAAEAVHVIEKPHRSRRVYSGGADAPSARSGARYRRRCAGATRRAAATWFAGPVATTLLPAADANELERTGGSRTCHESVSGLGRASTFPPEASLPDPQ
jgi:hypothetical protein